MQIQRFTNSLHTSCSLKFNFANLTQKYMCWSLFLRKFQALKSANLLKRDFNAGINNLFKDFSRTTSRTTNLLSPATLTITN